MSENGARSVLVMDWGGVLTTSLADSFREFCEDEGVPIENMREAFRDNEEARRLVFGLEDGSIPEAQFEEGFAGLLGVPHPELLARLLRKLGTDEPMIDAVRSAREQGVRTVLLSNSWGVSRYDPKILEHFDVLVISGEVGVRKPDPKIYEIAVERTGRPAGEMVFVDDLEHNLEPAREIGMATVHHRTSTDTVPELERLLGISLR